MKKLSALIVSSGSFLASSASALAAATSDLQVNPCASNSSGVNFNSLCNLSLTNSNVISKVITIALVVAALIALAFLIYGGIRWILSGGEKEKVEEARGTIIAALVGLVIVFAAYFIINIVFGLFGLGSIGKLNTISGPSLQIFGN